MMTLAGCAPRYALYVSAADLRGVRIMGTIPCVNGVDVRIAPMLWVKAFHLVFMVTWFAGLFYLPRLFVYHAMTEDEPGIRRFETMERKLYFGIMTPGAVLTLVFGIWLLGSYSWEALAAMRWLHAKLALIALLLVYHIWCGALLARFRRRANRHGHVWYRWFNEAPVVALIAIILLAVLKPDLGLSGQ